MTLRRRVMSSSQAASIITASSAQQVVGVDQVSQAMVSIDESMRHNLEGTRQLRGRHAPIRRTWIELEKTR